MTGTPSSPAVAVRSHPERARYDRETAFMILDSGHYGHLATFIDGDIRCVPMMYVRYGDAVHVHGRAGTPLMKHLLASGRLCFTVTLVDGLVLARSVRFNALNYRSIAIYGVPSEVTDPEHKARSFEKLAARNWPTPRPLTPPTSAQLASTTLLEFPVREFSVKIRTGPPMVHQPADDPALWSGHVDLKTVPSGYHPDRTTDPQAPLPDWPEGQEYYGKG